MITDAGESNSNEYSVLQQHFANDPGVFLGEGCFVFAFVFGFALFLFCFCLFFVLCFFGGGGWGSVLLLFLYPS
jgi:hypothetical protein